MIFFRTHAKMCNTIIHINDTKKHTSYFSFQHGHATLCSKTNKQPPKSGSHSFFNYAFIIFKQSLLVLFTTTFRLASLPACWLSGLGDAPLPDSPSSGCLHHLLQERHRVWMQPGGVREHVLSHDQAMGEEKKICYKSVHKLNFQ